MGVRSRFGMVSWPVTLVVAAMVQGLATGHEDSALALRNGSFETADEAGRPTGWSFTANPRGEQSVTLDPTDPMEGEWSAFVDSSEGANEFTNLTSSLDATPARGQRVRFRAAVRTADLTATTRVQLWCRVDLAEGVGAFDNMQDRPIRTDVWEYFDVVLDVADDATRLVFGIFILGRGKAWIDDATLEIVGEDTETTSPFGDGVLSAAMGAADKAPRQPFLTPWLFLALAVCVLFVLSQVGPQRAPSPFAEPAASNGDARRGLGALPRFALRFSVVYWLLYSLPQPFSAILPGSWQPVLEAYSNAMDRAVRWTAAAVFHVEGELVPPNGSGDTTYAYVRIFLAFAVAIVIALVWSLVDRRTTECRVTKDLLRTYLRFVLAGTMIGYGLAKLGDVQNQFPPPTESSLGRTYADSSPMGLLWTFMGASRSYTFFAGAAELLGGILVLFRRTTTLGAIVAFGVMLNVALLNLCYDVPVKQYSIHIVAMALFLLLPDVRRLARVFLWNRPVEGAELGPPYSRRPLRWAQLAVELALIVFVAGIPIYAHGKQEIEYARALASQTPSEPPGEEENGTRLMSRGFRWISEVPFNR